VVRWTFAEASTGQRREDKDLLAEIRKLG
jgi:hypothetical protein